jgi:hypothetical protein
MSPDEDMTMPSMTYITLPVLMASLIFLGLSSNGSRNVGSSESSILEVLQEEALDTIKFDRAIHFTTPEATDVIAKAGTYKIAVAEPSAVKLIEVKEQTTTVVDALNISHQNDIGTPIALYVKDDGEFPHVVLLLPGGKGFEAVGSFDGIRSRHLRLLKASPKFALNWDSWFLPSSFQ